MRAILLAAGRGSRMGGLTGEQPKCLVRIAGRTLLDWQLAALRDAGIHDIAIVRGYLADHLQPAGCKFFENPQWAETNMVATLARAGEWLEQHDCLVSYSDIVYHPDILTQLAANPGDLVISHDRHWLPLWRDRFEDPLEDAETLRLDAAGRLAAIGSRAEHLEEIEGQYMGLLKITPNGWDSIRGLLEGLPEADRNRLDMTALLQRLLREGAEIHAIPIHGRWCEVDSGSDLEVYEQRLGQTGEWSHDWRWESALNE